MLATLEDYRRIAMVEKALRLGSSLARMIAIYPSRVLSDRHVSSALANGLLISNETADKCSSCNQSTFCQHGDVCDVRRNVPGTVRHNTFRDPLARQAKEAGSTAVTECVANAPDASSFLRGDVFVTGSAAPDGHRGCSGRLVHCPAEQQVHQSRRACHSRSRRIGGDLDQTSIVCNDGN